MCLCFVGQAQDCNQEFRGQIIDLHDNSPLEGAAVSIDFGDAVTYSDSKGLFILESLCVTNFTITISHPNCKTQEKAVRLPGPALHIFYMEHHITALNEVVLEEQRNTGSAKTTPEVQLDSEDLESYSGLTLADALDQAAGVSVLRTGNVIAKPVIHGMFGSRVAMVNNGMRVRDQEWGADHAPTIDLNDLAAIDVVKGASALRYGGDTPGGVLLFKQERYVPADTLYGKVISGINTNGRGGNLTAQVTKGFSKGTYFKTVGTLKHRGDVQAPDYLLSNTGWREMAFSLTTGRNKYIKGWEAKYSFFDTTIGILRSAHIGNVGDLYRAVISPTPLRIAPFTYTISPPKQQAENHSIQLFYFKRFAEKTKLELRYNLQWNQREEFDIRRGDDRGKASIDMQLTTHDFNAHLAWKPQSALSSTAGIQLQLQDNFSNPKTGVKRLIPDYVSYGIGGYGSVTYRPNNLFTADFGMRLDWNQMDARKYYDQKDWVARGYASVYPNFITRTLATQLLTRPQFDFLTLSFTAGLQAAVSKALTLQLNLNHSERPPNAAELFSDGLHHSLASIEYGNLDLDSESSNKLLAGITYQNKRVTLNLTPHFARIKNFIQLQPSGFEQTIRGAFPVWSYIAVNADFYGLDVDWKWALTPQVNFHQQHSWIAAQQTANGTPLINIPPYTAVQNISYQPKRLKALEFKLSARYTATQRHYPNTNFTHTFLEDGAYIDRLIDVSTPPEDYTLFDAQVKFKWPLNEWKYLQLQLSGSNLLNTAYRNYLNRLRFYADEMGRNVQLNLKYQF
ncbi:MAG: TonB-dependent receptor [Flavobacteriaceae bacterium]